MKGPASASTMSDHKTASAPAPRRDRVRTWLIRTAAGLGLACLFLTSLILGSYVTQRYAGSIEVSAAIVLLMLAVVGLMTGGAVAREFIYWRRSVRLMARIANDLRAGEVAMAELDRVGGGARFLVEPVRSILMDLREQKRLNAELNEEMRQRILSRTDALERQLGSMKTQAARDALTGLGNRRGFDAMLPQVFEACRTACEDLCVLMIDVDNFKPLNDTLGHAAGDELLKSMGEIIRSSIREHDSAFRVGGDEFVILLPRTNKALGEKLAGRLSSLVEHLVRPLKLAHPPALSIGAAALSDGKCREAKTLIDHADKHLYAVKGKKPGRVQRSVA
jgi:diguanylate cyclase (GGDEF)-like protein